MEKNKSPLSLEQRTESEVDETETSKGFTFIEYLTGVAILGLTYAIFEQEIKSGISWIYKTTEEVWSYFF